MDPKKTYFVLDKILQAGREAKYIGARLFISIRILKIRLTDHEIQLIMEKFEKKEKIIEIERSPYDMIKGYLDNTDEDCYVVKTTDEFMKYVENDLIARKKENIVPANKKGNQGEHFKLKRERIIEIANQVYKENKKSFIKKNQKTNISALAKYIDDNRHRWPKQMTDENGNDSYGTNLENITKIISNAIKDGQFPKKQ